MEDNKITIKDVLIATIGELKQVNVPASIGPDRMMSICVPIAKAMKNLQACVESIEENEQETKAEAEGPSIALEPMEEEEDHEP